MWQTIKPLILWNYGRTTRQYEILCALCVAFIFLTPPEWYAGKERNQNQAPQIVTRLIVSPENFSPAIGDKARLELVRELTGDKNVERFDLRERFDENGKLIAYEIIVR